MKKKQLSIIAFMLAALMTAGSLFACGKKDVAVSTSPKASEEAESATATESPSIFESDSESEPANENGTESEGDVESESAEGNRIDVVANEYDKIIDNAYGLSNSVQSYFSDPSRSHLVIENKQMELNYAKSNCNDQLISYIKNKNGGTYIENTMDVFVTMTNGNTFYASRSNKNPKT